MASLPRRIAGVPAQCARGAAPAARGGLRDHRARGAFGKLSFAVHAVAAMNPCRADFRDPTRECQCSPRRFSGTSPRFRTPSRPHRHSHRSSGSKYKELRGDGQIESSASVRERCYARERFKLHDTRREEAVRQLANAGAAHSHHCAISSDGEKLLETAIQRLGLSARAHDRILKVSRTIADLEGAPSIEPST